MIQVILNFLSQHVIIFHCFSLLYQPCKKNEYFIRQKTQWEIITSSSVSCLDFQFKSSHFSFYFHTQRLEQSPTKSIPFIKESFYLLKTPRLLFIKNHVKIHKSNGVFQKAIKRLKWTGCG